MIDIGAGAPLVLIPGIQGRWEYMRPAVDALATRSRVLTFALCGERSSRLAFDRTRGLDNYVDQIASILRARGIDRAALCGVSFGGLVALRFAASRPQQTRALILVSTPGPSWRLTPRHALYARLPWLFGPLFLAETPRRLRRELSAAFPERDERRRFATRQLKTLLTAPISLGRLGERARLMTGAGDVAGEARRVTAPTLIVTGDPDLDHVVPVDGTSEYARLIVGATTGTIAQTGHLGCITRPVEFARMVHEFLAAQEREDVA